MSESFKVSGKKFAMPATQSAWRFEKRPGGWIIASSPEGSRKRLALWQGRGKLGVSFDGSLYFGDIEKSSEGSGRPGSQGSGGSDSDLIAQFPGKVRKLLIAAGATVKAGEPIILLEAMKMEFTIKAPFSGVISKVLVQEGQQLVPGDRFFEIKPS